VWYRQAQREHSAICGTEKLLVFGTDSAKYINMSDLLNLLPETEVFPDLTESASYSRKTMLVTDTINDRLAGLVVWVGGRSLASHTTKS